MTKVFNVTLQSYEYRGDARSKTWNDCETWLVEHTESGIADFCHVQNVRIINDAILKAESVVATFQGYIDKENRRIDVIRSLTDEQREALGHTQKNIFERHTDISYWENTINEHKTIVTRLGLWDMKTIIAEGLIPYRWIFSETLIWNFDNFKKHTEGTDDTSE